MIHHVGLDVTDLHRSACFYDAVLAKLGWRRGPSSEQRVGWGLDEPVFFIRQNGATAAPGFGHVAFNATGIAAVKAAWEAGIAAGGNSAADPAQDRGRGRRAYSARLRDPDGYEIEIAAG